MKFYKNLYVGGTVKNLSRVKWRLKHGAGQFQLYVVSLASNGSDQLDIIHCSYLVQKYYPKKEMRIAGLADSYPEALNLVLKMMEESLRHTGKPDIRAFLAGRQRGLWE